jgi:hypothetical protein
MSGSQPATADPERATRTPYPPPRGTPSRKSLSMVNRHANAAMLYGRAQREIGDRTDDDVNRKAREDARLDWTAVEREMLDYLTDLEARAAGRPATTKGATAS